MVNRTNTAHTGPPGEWCENPNCASCKAWREHNDFRTVTTTTQALVRQSEEERLLQLVKTKDQIIASLRRQLTGSEEFARELMRLL